MGLMSPIGPISSHPCYLCRVAAKEGLQGGWQVVHVDGTLVGVAEHRHGTVVTADHHETAVVGHIEDIEIALLLTPVASARRQNWRLKSIRAATLGQESTRLLQRSSFTDRFCPRRAYAQHGEQQHPNR